MDCVIYIVLSSYEKQGEQAAHASPIPFLLMSNPRFYFADGNSSICRHNWKSYFLSPSRSNVYLSHTDLEVLLGNIRGSRVLVTPLVHHPGWHRWYIDLDTYLAHFRITDSAITFDFQHLY